MTRKFSTMKVESFVEGNESESKYEKDGEIVDQLFLT